MTGTVKMLKDWVDNFHRFGGWENAASGSMADKEAYFENEADFNKSFAAWINDKKTYTKSMLAKYE